ncbi:MAG: TusE/DsrC/DsvC family sulfur relay protein [Methylococcaceae bacterium]|nr:TusE/DsrC/DsvC family sulfur relay protein [Methylococcaceae bacterium]
MVTVGGVVEITESGFLVKASDWNEAVAEELAARSNIALTEQHWEILYFLRDYYFRFNHLPNARLFVKAVQKRFGEEKGNSRYLHGLFPDSPVRYACLIAGLPKPPGCL